MAKIYRDTKQAFDDSVYAYLCRRLSTPVEKSDAFMVGAVDEYGAPRGNAGFSWAYTRLDALIFSLIRRCNGNLPPMPEDIADADLLSIMDGVKTDAARKAGIAKLVGLIEESGYLPADVRTYTDGAPDENDMGLEYDERVSFAFTIATFLLYTIKLGKYPSDAEFDEVLESTEATFAVRSIGDRNDCIKYIVDGHNGDDSDLNGEGYLLAVRVAKVIMANSLVAGVHDTVENQGRNWEKLANAH